MKSLKKGKMKSQEHEHENEEIYQEHIIDLYKNPKNRGFLKNPTHEKQEFNPLCGDKVKIQIIEENGIIKEVKFDGIGCAIMTASASLITDYLKGKTVKEAKTMNSQDIEKLLQIKVSPLRIKCLTIPLKAIQGALENA